MGSDKVVFLILVVPVVAPKVRVVAAVNAFTVVGDPSKLNVD